MLFAAEFVQLLCATVLNLAVIRICSYIGHRLVSRRAPVDGSPVGCHDVSLCEENHHPTEVRKDLEKIACCAICARSLFTRLATARFAKLIPAGKKLFLGALNSIFDAS